MKKQIVSIIMVCLLAAGLCACGSNGQQTTASEETSMETAVTVADTAASEDAASESANTVTGEGFGTFQTTDLEGNEVTEAIFAQKEYTMINMWATFCPPCIAEMPDLEELSGKMPDNMQLIGLVLDVPNGLDTVETLKEANAIVEETGVTFPCLKIWEEGSTFVSSFSSFVPTTVFVDSNGVIVGEPIIGADIDSYKDRIISLSKE